VATDMQEAGYLVWQRFAEISGDQAMVARLQVIGEAQKAGIKMTVSLPDGRELRIPEMIAAEAAVAALGAGSEGEWRADWTRRLVNVAVKWQDPATTQGVVSVLNHTDAVIADLKAAGIWPWGAE
jgi:hypothetical protein